MRKVLPLICSLLVLTVIQSTSWAQWVQTSLGDNHPIEYLAASDSNLYAGEADHGDIFRSSDEGANWVSISSGLNYPSVLSLFARGKNLLANTIGGDFFSTDAGEHWITVNKNPDSAAGQIYSLVSLGDNIFAGSNYGVFKSSNYGISWKSVNSDLFKSYRIFDALLVSDQNLYAGCNSPIQIGELFLSTDEGASWKEIDSGMSNATIDALGIVGSKLFAGTNHGLFFSTNDGSTWTPSNLGLPYIQFITVKDSVLFVIGGSDTVFVSTDLGSSWRGIPPGLPTQSFGLSLIQSCLIYGKYFFIGTDNGVWRRPLSEMRGQNAVAKAEATTQSLRCYPNPLSQSTTISFTPEASGYAEISIVNQLGVEVARIFSGELDAGEHSFTWDATSSRGVGPLRPTGMNECVVRMNGQVRSLPLAVLR